MFEELGAGVVDARGGGVGLENPGGKFVWEVFTGVEVFEEAGCGFEVFVQEVDGGFGGGTVGADGVFKEG